MIEIWKTIEEYPTYMVSNLGRVKNLNFNRSGKEKLLQPCGKTYKMVSLCKDNTKTNVCVHRLVAESFIPNPNNLECVNHIDENKHNNRVDNLEWISRADNVNYGTSHERTVKTKIKNGTMKHKSVCQLLNNQIIATYHSVKEATMNTGINSSNIVQVCKGDRQTAGGYTWRYAS